MFRELYLCLTMTLVLSTGCSPEDELPGRPQNLQPGSSGNYDDLYGYYSTTEIRFLDQVTSNASIEKGVLRSSFLGLDGLSRSPAEIAQNQHLVLVILRGYTVPICPACSRQTAQLIANYAQFVEQGAEVAVVYPIQDSGQRHGWEELLANARRQLDNQAGSVPFPIFFDVGLTAVNELGLAQDLSKPATFIVSREGEVAFAYIGHHGITDRPSVEAILKEIERLNQESGTPQVSPLQSAPDVPPATHDESI